MLYEARAIWVWCHWYLGIPLGKLHTVLPAVAFAIDAYYRVEWFDLHTPAHAALAFLFGAQ